ncbi:hypothetical protein [Streptomyces sp. NPDC040750]|uniref:hypothetical protein n=1 Tax=Streptomyces sp. NPDC040750 TaxID=3154491 RepID=UPI00340150D1
MTGQGVLASGHERAVVLDFIRAGYTAQPGRVRHHLGAVVVSTADGATAEALWVAHRRAWVNAGPHSGRPCGIKVVAWM